MLKIRTMGGGLMLVQIRRRFMRMEAWAAIGEIDQVDQAPSTDWR